jgi:hypothetical protein
MGQKHHPAARVADEASQKIHGRCGAGGWPAPHFLFSKLLFHTSKLLSRRGFARTFVRDLFSRDFHRKHAECTTCAQVSPNLRPLFASS